MKLLTLFNLYSRYDSNRSLTKELFFINLLSIVSGLASTLPFYFLQVTMTEINSPLWMISMVSLIHTPFLLKPIWAPILDNLYAFKSPRYSSLLYSFVLIVFSMLIMSSNLNFSKNIITAKLILIILFSIFICWIFKILAKYVLGNFD